MDNSDPPVDRPNGGRVHDPEKRRRRSSGVSKHRPSFSQSRASFIPANVLRHSESDKRFSQRLTLRHQSRSFSAEADPTNVLDPKTRITIEWRDVGYTVMKKRSLLDRIREAKSKKVIHEPVTLLKGMSGSVKPGEVIGILGPSGSGKTVFLNILAGRQTGGIQTGQILINGLPRTSQWRHVVAFVEQDTSYLDARLTVQELVQYVAELTVPSKYKPEEREIRIKHVLKMMDLLHIKESRIGGDGVKGISGGERKRLAVALELLQEPKVLLLDEPTSGLDSKTAADFVRYLYQLAILDNLTIIMTVHQPRMSILSKYERILLMAAGSTMFYGSVDDALKFFEDLGYTKQEEENPAEFFLEVLRQAHEGGDGRVQEAWNQIKSPVKSPALLGPKVVDRPDRNLPYWKEFKIICSRYYKVVRRDKEYFLTTNLLIFFPGLLSLAVFFQLPSDGFAAVQNRLGLLSYLIFDGTAISVMTALVFANAWRVRRERYRYFGRASVYYLAMMVIQFPVWLIGAFLAMIVQYYVCGLRYTPFTAILIFLGFYMVTTVQALAMGVVISACTTSIQIAFTLGTFYSIIVGLFNGSTVNTQEITWVLRWIRYISPLFYLLTGVSQNEFNGQTLDGQPGEYWLGLYALNVVSVIWCAGALLIITVVSIVAASFFFRYKTHPVLHL